MITFDQYKMYYIEPKLGGDDRLGTGTCSFVRVGGSMAYYSNDIYGGFELDEELEESMDIPITIRESTDVVDIEDERPSEIEDLVDVKEEESGIVELPEKRVRFADLEGNRVDREGDRGEINVEDIDTLIKRLDEAIRK